MSCRSNDDDDDLEFPPLASFPVGRIGHLVPILGGRRLAGLVRVGGRACPSRGCQVGMAGHLVGPAPTPHGALGGRKASTGYDPATDASASAQPSEGRTKAWWPPRSNKNRAITLSLHAVRAQLHTFFMITLTNSPHCDSRSCYHADF